MSNRMQEHTSPLARRLTRRDFLAAAGAVTAAVLAPGLVGCATSKNIVVERPSTTQVDTQLTFFGFKYEPLNVDVIEDILRGYMDEHPDVSIVYEGIKSRPYFEALEKRMASGNGDDVFMVNHDTVLAFEGKDYLADLADLSSIDSFSTLALGQMRSEGSAIRYVPTSISAFGLYCNTTLLADKGLTAPRTLPEFLDACQVFADEGTLPVVANNDISLKTLAIARGLAADYARDDAPEQIKAYNADPRALAAKLREGFEVVEELVSRGFVDARLALETEKTADDLEQFATGENPFMLTGAWASARVHDLAPDLAYEVHPYPVLDDGPVLVVNVDTRVSANAQSKHAQLAKDFIAHLAKPESIEPFANSQCSFSPLQGNAAPDDESLKPLSNSFGAGGAVIGSDDNLLLPIWEATRQCAVSLLEGSTAEEAEAQLHELLASDGGDAQ